MCHRPGGEPNPGCKSGAFESAFMKSAGRRRDEFAAKPIQKVTKATHEGPGDTSDWEIRFMSL